MYSESGTGYDVVQYEMEILTGTWDSGGKPLDNCGRWSNENGHTFVGIWRNGKPHTGKGAWSELMRGRGQAAMAVMQGEWRAGLGSGVLTSGPDAWRVALDQSKVSAERKPWEVERDVGDEVRLSACRTPMQLRLMARLVPQDTTGWEICRFNGSWDEAGLPKTGDGEWLSQSKHRYKGAWAEYVGRGQIMASKRAGKATWDDSEHVELPTFSGEWVERVPWEGAGTWYDLDDKVYEGSLKGGKPFTGRGTWQVYETDAAGNPVASVEGDGCATDGHWWDGLLLGDALVERVEKATVKARWSTRYMNQPLVELYEGCMAVLKVSWCGIR
jgi:hypothetical protein